MSCYNFDASASAVAVYVCVSECLQDRHIKENAHCILLHYQYKIFAHINSITIQIMICQ